MVSFRTLGLLFLLLCSGCVVRKTMPLPCPPCDEMKFRLEALSRSPQPILRGQKLLVAKTMARFYREESYRPVWSSEGCLLSRVDDLIAAVRQADLEGLNPEEYHLNKIVALRNTWLRHPRERARTPQEELDLDFLLTDAYLGYTSHLLGGHTDPEMERQQWRN